MKKPMFDNTDEDGRPMSPDQSVEYFRRITRGQNTRLLISEIERNTLADLFSPDEIELIAEFRDGYHNVADLPMSELDVEAEKMFYRMLLRKLATSKPTVVHDSRKATETDATLPKVSTSDVVFSLLVFISILGCYKDDRDQAYEHHALRYEHNVAEKGKLNARLILLQDAIISTSQLVSDKGGDAIRFVVHHSGIHVLIKWIFG